MRVLALFISLLLAATCLADSGVSFYGAGHGGATAGGSGAVGGYTYTTYTTGRTTGTIYCSQYTATAGAVNYAHVYVQFLGGGGERVEIGLWQNDGTFITSIQSDQFWTAQNNVWINLTLPSQETLSATTYIVGVIAGDSNWSLGNATESSGGSGSVAGTMGSLGNITPPSFAGGGYMIYIDNSAGDPS